MQTSFESDKGFEGDAAVERAFIGAIDAKDEDEFIRRVWAGLRRTARAAAPVLRPVGRRALPMALRLLGQPARPIGGAQQVDAMDAFADVAADLVFTEHDIDEFVPVLAGMAGRYAVRTLTSAATRASRPAAARAIGRAVTRATSLAAREVVSRRGPRAIRAIPQVVRGVTILVRRGSAAQQALPSLIRRAATGVAASPQAAARFARPSRAARQLRRRAKRMARIEGSEANFGRPRL
jgi:hypothetical protein